MSALQTLFQDYIVTTLKAAGMTALEDEEIVARRSWLPAPDGPVPYGIVVHPAGNEPEAIGSNQRDDIGYPFYVTMAAHPDSDMEAERDVIGSWRQKIRRSFNHVRPTGITESGTNILNSRARMGSINEKLPKDAYRYDLSRMVVVCWARETRTP